MLLFSGHGKHIQLKPRPDAPETGLLAACGYLGAEAHQAVDAPEGSLGRFGYFFPDGVAPPVHGGETRALDSVADAMVDAGPAEEDNSAMPAVMTYFGQFIDHDITANTDSETDFSRIDRETILPVDRSKVVGKLFNLRTGALDLDSVYGGTAIPPGPFAQKLLAAMRAPFDRAKLFLGTTVPVPADDPQRVDLPPDIARDLLRFGRLTGGDDPILTPDDLDGMPEELAERFLDDAGNPKPAVAVIGDGRNDENLAVAQFHLSLLRFHNVLVDAGRREPGLGAPVDDADQLFDWARAEVTKIYQWLTVHVYLRSICDDAVLDDVLSNAAPVYQVFLGSAPPVRDGLFPLPLEFSVAAFRFGHTMARASYDWNPFFGRDGTGVDGGSGRASFHLLQSFTGNGARPMFGAPRLPSNWVADMARLLNLGDAPRADRNARKLDTRIAPPLFAMRNEPEGLFHTLKRLPRRNLRRGQLLNLPSAQACIAGFARAGIAIEPLSADQIGSGPTGAQIRAGDFLGHTPLWFYVLKEAEIQGQGERLGALGSRLVAETLVGLLVADPKSYWHIAGSDSGRWHPTDGVRPKGEPVTSLEALMRAAGTVA